MESRFMGIYDLSLINTFVKTIKTIESCCSIRHLREKNGERKTLAHSFHIRSDDDDDDSERWKTLYKSTDRREIIATQKWELGSFV